MSSTLDLSYNTDTNKLLIPEYGRNVEKMVQHAVKIQDEIKEIKLQK